MVELISGLSAARVRENLEGVRREIAEAGARAGRWSGSDSSEQVEVLAATKYVAADDLPKLAEAGVRLVGENRAAELERKVAVRGELFAWDFIGALQSRKVALIVPHVRWIHSLASSSAMRALERHRELARADLRVLIQVNVSGEPGKAGVTPAELDAMIELAPVPVVGLMTMPPLSRDPADSRRWFAALRELAHARGLQELSMGTTQDYAVAVEEGATIVRIGTKLYT